MCDRIDPEIEAAFPNLVLSGYKKTSDSDVVYNCVAWAAAWDKNQWWDVIEEPGTYWPENVPKGWLVENFVGLFSHIGFALCDNAELEDGFEKIAIYGDGKGIFQHVARQTGKDKWTSKLGACEDIEHKSLAAFDGSSYGSVVKTMKRKILDTPNQSSS